MNITKLTLDCYWFINIDLTIGTGGITILIPLKVKGSGKINKVKEIDLQQCQKSFTPDCENIHIMKK